MENKNGQGIFYGVIGVATLVVAIIGATFAYFSAQATTTGDTITGNTLDVAEALTLNVTRVNKAVTNATNIDLVPTDIDGTSATSMNTAVAANCEADGYTACHLYKIEAGTSQNVTNANIYIDSLTVSGAAVKDKTAWKYAVYEGTDTTATTPVINGDFEITTASTIDMHKNGALTTAGKTYYLLIYIENADKPQNTANNDNVTGTYSGTVTLKAAGGKVAATFNA